MKPFARRLCAGNLLSARVIISMGVCVDERLGSALKRLKTKRFAAKPRLYDYDELHPIEIFMVFDDPFFRAVFA